jgi:Holliday junction resolvase RusA-like endonuclease
MYLPSSAPVRAFKAAIIATAKAKIRKPTAEPVAVRMVAIFARPQSHLTAAGVLRAGAPDRPGRNCGDVDNLAKGVLDALNGIAWDDDSQVVDLRVIKAFGPRDYVDVWIDPPEILTHGRSR